jgi:hypothetical protein
MRSARASQRRAHSSTSGVIRYRACEILNSWNWSACDALIVVWRFASEPVHGARSNLALFELDIHNWFSVRTSPSGCSQEPKGRGEREMEQKPCQRTRCQ